MKYTISFILFASLTLSACSPIGTAVGAGAALGVASQTDEGIGGTARDIRIKALIADRWFRYNVETFAKLNLTVKEGRVLITGIVQNPDQRVEAVRLAWQIDGVKQVINEIRVANSDGIPGYVRDEWITTRLRAALTFDGGVYSINYSIDTVQGNIFLMGVARTQAELDRVVEIARTIPNVKQVVSYITLAGQTLSDAAQNPSLTQTTTTTTTTTTVKATTTPAESDAPPQAMTPPANPSATPAPVTGTPLPPPPSHNGAMLPP